jgi:hypothetical protein
MCYASAQHLQPGREPQCDLCVGLHFQGVVGECSRDLFFFYLVIFKDTRLKTIIDLYVSHLQMLTTIQNQVLEWLATKHAKTFHMFFHYMPSVFQLHLHVTDKAQYINMSLAHFLQSVTKNLQHNLMYYVEAMFLTSLCRTLLYTETHETVMVPI